MIPAAVMISCWLPRPSLQKRMVRLAPDNPASPVRQLIASSFSRRSGLGIAIGATVIAILMSPLGKQSGGHFNPAITLTFFRLGKVAPWDALFYAAGQFSGAIAGVALATYLNWGRAR